MAHEAAAQIAATASDGPHAKGRSAYLFLRRGLGGPRVGGGRNGMGEQIVCRDAAPFEGNNLHQLPEQQQSRGRSGVLRRELRQTRRTETQVRSSQFLPFES